MKKLAVMLTAAAGASLVAQAAVQETEWWNFDFNDEGLTIEALTDTEAPITAIGQWVKTEEDSSTIGKKLEDDESNALVLNTNGDDLKWTPNSQADGTNVYIDADIYFVASDSEPAIASTDNVQCAMYLKEEVGEDETVTKSLKVYAKDNLGVKTWMDTDCELEDGWHHVKVTMDYTSAIKKFYVTIDDVVVNAVEESLDDPHPDFTVAVATATAVTEVAFRGTGAVDNFVGKTWVDVVQTYEFAANVNLDGVLQSSETKTRGVGTDADWEFMYATFEDDAFTSWIKSIVVVTDVATGDTTQFDAVFDPEEATLTFSDEAAATYITVDTEEGKVIINVPTTGATESMVLVTVNYTTGAEDPPTPPEPAVEPEAVDIGEGVADLPDDVLPIEMTEDGFTVRFVAKQAGVTYELVATDDLASADEDYAAVDGASVTTTEEDVDTVIELTDANPTESVKFYKVKVSVPSAE